MQEYAEQAAFEHVAKFLQPAFTKEKRGRKTAPFSGSLSVEQVNTYLRSVLLPTISIEPDRFVVLADGTSVNMTVDNRVVFQCAPNVAVMKISDPLELVDPLPGKTYSTYDDNLVGYWRDNSGRHTDYDMWAQPVFNGINDYFILKTDEVAK